MASKYCPNCKMNVLTVREDLDICLIIILGIFTAGIGILIYLAIYYEKEQNRCVHCKSICHPISKIQHTGDFNSKPSNINKYKKVDNPIDIGTSSVTDSNFCSNCGVKIGEREGLKYCAFCGTKIN